MKSIYSLFQTIIIIFLFCSLFSSCQRNENMSKFIPGGANFVMVLNTESIIKKGGVTNFEDLSIFNFIDSSDFQQNEKLNLTIDHLKKSPERLGINLKQDLYYFEIEDSIGHTYNCYLTSLNDAEAFQREMTSLLKYSHADYATWKEEGHNYLKLDYHGCVLWNDDKVIFVLADNGFELDYMYLNISSYLENTKKNNMSNNEIFQDFLFDRKDVDIWTRTNFNNRSLKKYAALTQKNTVTISSEFLNGAISTKTKFYPNKNLKKVLDPFELSKNRFNENLLQFIPADNAMLLAGAVPSEGISEVIRTLRKDSKQLALFRDLLSKKNEKYMNNLDGSFVFSIVDSKDYTEKMYLSQPKVIDSLRLKTPDLVYMNQLEILNNRQIKSLNKGDLVQVWFKARRKRSYDNFDIYGDQYIEITDQLAKGKTAEDLISSNDLVQLYGTSIVHGTNKVIDVQKKMSEFIFLVEYKDEKIMLEMLKELDSSYVHFRAPDYLPENSGIGQPKNARKNNLLYISNNQTFLDFYPLEFQDDVDNLLEGHLIYTHSLVKYDVNKNGEMEVKWLDEKKIEKLFKEKKIKIKHQIAGVQKDKYLLTASSKELQKFIKKYMSSNDSEKWNTSTKFTLSKINATK